MRGVLAVAIAAAVISIGIPISCAQAIAPAALRSAIEQVNPTERVGRVCREVCNGDVCRRRCFNRVDYNEGYTERRSASERSRQGADRWRYRGVDRGPGVRLHLGSE